MWRFGAWLSGLVSQSAAVGWLVTGVLVLVLVVLVAAVARLWPVSRRWAMLNRLHRVAARNEAELRAAARRELAEAGRSLQAARRSCVLSGRPGQASEVDRLLRDLEVARDRLASDYVPSPANAPRQRRELGLAALDATETVAACCAAAARHARGGAAVPADLLSAARQALADLDDKGLAVP